jgi:hypothetical protein
MCELVGEGAFIVYVVKYHNYPRFCQFKSFE